MYSDLAWRKRQQERELREWAEDRGKYVDIGVELRVVVADEVNGEELIEDKPKLRVIRTHYAGGIINVRDKRPRIIAPSQNRTVWYCSEEQEQIILHPDTDPDGTLIYGSEGGGKTETLPMWHYWRWLENLGERREAGQLAPTNARLEVFLEAFRARFPPGWYRYRSSKRLITLCDGTRIRCISTHQQSKAQGSRVQAYSWSWAGADECQDYVERWDDIQARGRAAKATRGYKQARTATAKDTSEWRSAKSKLLSTGDWRKATLLGLSSPFVPKSFWEKAKRSMSPREYARRVLAQDVGVELAVYYGWLRDRNLITYPQLAIDVTPTLLAEYPSYTCPGARFVLLGCHDPGNICNVTEILRHIVLGDVPTWIVVGELKTEQTTAEQHAAELVLYLQRTFGIERRIRDRWGQIRPDPDSSKIALFLDPHGKGETATDYDTVYGAFQAAGIDVFSPAPLTGRIKRRARVQMVNRLFCDATLTARLVVACGPDKQPVAPVLVDALETLEKRAGEDDPEGYRRKDKRDKTHAPAALGYGLWPFEQQAITEATRRRAVDAARRLAVA